MRRERLSAKTMVKRLSLEDRFTVMQQEMTPTSGQLGGTTMKCPTRVITYAWGEKYVDTLLTLTLPALLAPGNLPYVASEVPCELVILTQRRFFSKFNHHPAIARLRNICSVRLIRLDDLIVSKDKYGMTLTYALHRGFSDLGPAMTEHWQIFLNADFILADGSLRTVIGHLFRGQKIVAAPSYCTIAEEVIPELRNHLDDATSTLSISHRELARLVLQHRHTVIRGKTVNQTPLSGCGRNGTWWSLTHTGISGSSGSTARRPIFASSEIPMNSPCLNSGTGVSPRTKSFPVLLTRRLSRSGW